MRRLPTGASDMSPRARICLMSVIRPSLARLYSAAVWHGRLGIQVRHRSLVVIRKRKSDRKTLYVFLGGYLREIKPPGSSLADATIRD